MVFQKPTRIRYRYSAHYVALLVTPLLLVPRGAEAAGITAHVVALDQVIIYNRLGVLAPTGMMYALARDVFPKNTPPEYETLANSCATKTCTPGNVQLRSSKRPRPLTLRVHEGETLTVHFQNLLNPVDITNAGNAQPPGAQVPNVQSEQPVTRNVGLHIHGVNPTNISSDGSHVGANESSLVAPGDSATYVVTAPKEGAYTITSGPNLGGEGGSGALANGLFGVLNVEPAGSEWYRSQLTQAEMQAARDRRKHFDQERCGAGKKPSSGQTCDREPILDYDAVYPTGHPYAGLPILNLVQNGELVHNDLNAIITGPGRQGIANEPSNNPAYPNRGEPFREFTVVFHDEVKVVQAFPQWYTDLKFTLGSVKDGFAINYGTGGIGSEIIANRLGVGPMKDCVECKGEEFFLTAWVVGDPAMIVDVPANAGLEALGPGQTPSQDRIGAKARKAFYPEDPSNVWHGYLNDRTKIRNIHVGTEHHIFHLHAHQWLFAALDSGSNYLDAQVIGPGSSFSYEIAYGGGNRNKTPGDSIFHCHFYPHFAQGMWGLWRVHDTFEPGSTLNRDGTVAERGLPDGEIPGGGYRADGTPIPGGTPVPAVVPLPGKAMAPMPGDFVADTNGDGRRDTPHMGYPFYIAGVAGHRPPSPPLDIVKSGGIPRHVITGGTAEAITTATDFSKVLTTANGQQIPENGTKAEKAAMAFHGPQPGPGHESRTPEGSKALFEVNGLPAVAGAPFADPCRSDNGALVGKPRVYKASAIQLPVTLNKVGWHFEQQRILVLNQDVDDTLSGARAPEPFVMRANTNDCVDFDHTNRVPSVYTLDDFQVRTPTDIIGQHIHLVKFDVTSADGAANGWNYEDGTFSPDEIKERIDALHVGRWTGNAALGAPGLRTTRQRWYVDPLFDQNGIERGLGNVFTHDHFGPSTHQQNGLYATLLIEPQNSVWRDPTTGDVMGKRGDGGPTSWRADILPANRAESYREFFLEFSDFQLAYRGAEGDGGDPLNAGNTPVNPSDRQEVGLPFLLEPNCQAGPDGGPNGCRPEAISAADPGTYVVNYRNEPTALRVRDPKTNSQAASDAGDLSLAFNSRVTRADDRLNQPPNAWPYPKATASEGAQTGDPYTPILRVYEGDKVSIRAQVGGQEESHNFSINGIRWLQSFGTPWSGYRNSQVMGLSEYFRFEMPSIADVKPGPFEDYRYQTGSSVGAVWNGSWGIMRAYRGKQAGLNLKALPSNPNGKAPPNHLNRDRFNGVCPVDPAIGKVARRRYTVWAVRAKDVLPDGTLTYNPSTEHGGPLHDPTGLLYVLKEDIDPRSGKLKADRRPEPLILRAVAGDCITVTLENHMSADPDDLPGYNALPMIVNHFNANQVKPSRNVGLHAQLVEYNLFNSDGMNVGFNPLQTAAPGGSVTYHWYAGKIDVDPDSGYKTAVPVEFGAINLMGADPVKHSNKGLLGALVIEPKGASWPAEGERGSDGLYTRAAVTVTHPGGYFRDFVALFQDDINLRFGNGDAVPTVAAEEEPEDSGQKGVNYRSDPLWFRLGVGPIGDPNVTRTVDYSKAFAGEPVTPIFTASQGQPVRFRVLKPGGHSRNGVFHLHGHVWAQQPYNEGSTVITAESDHTFYHGEQVGHGPSNHFDAVPLGGAGTQGDYLYRDMAPVHVDNGEWGIFRVQ